MGLINALRAALTLALTITWVITCTSCAATKPAATTQAQVPAETHVRVPRKPGAPVVLVAMPKNEHTLAVWKVLGDELASEFDVVPEWTTKDTGPEFFSRAVNREHPVCIILMDTAVRAYGHYQRGLPAGTKHPPAVVLMTPYADETARSLVNTSGITYEIPSVVQFVTLRALLDRPVRRVGVVYRPQLSGFIRRQRELAKPEQIDIVGVEVPTTPSEAEISAALTRLYDVEKIDTLWILNDSGLLTPALVSTAWLPKTTSNRHVPVIVGVSSLLNKQFKLGSFAMLPDHASLGTQVAKMVFELAAHHWAFTKRGMQPPLSVKTVVDIEATENFFGLRKGALETIDEVVR